MQICAANVVVGMVINMFFFNTLFRLLEEINNYAMKEMYDEQAIKRKIMELQVQNELGEIDDKKYKKQEKKLLDQLKAAREYNQQAAMDEMDE